MASVENKTRISLRFKLIGFSVGAIVFSIGLVSVISYFMADSALMKQAFNQLTAVRESKKSQIERFFSERIGDITVLAKNPYVLEAYKDLEAAFDAGGGLEGKKFKGHTNSKYDAPQVYITAHDKHHDVFEHYMKQYGYYDLFLMCADDGDAVYTVTKEGDFGQRTSDIDSSLKDVWKAAKNGKISLSDTKPYAPSNNIPAQFVAAPIKDGNNKIVGVVALQISMDGIEAIMGERSGMGDSGESYLVGEDHLMRSDSYLDSLEVKKGKESKYSVAASFAKKITLDTDAVKEALKKSSKTEIIEDYNGNDVLSAYAPVKIGDTTWALMAEIDLAEVKQPVNNLRFWIIIIAVAIIALISFLLYLFINKGIIQPVTHLKDVTGIIATGDLTQRVQVMSNDEIGDLSIDFNNFVINMHEMISQIITASQNLSQAVQEIASGNENLSQRTSEQASSLEEIASTIEETTSTINQNADNAREADRVSETSKTLAQSGSGVVSEAVSAINEISDSSKKIGEIISVINEIAFQTNLLALNAAVEAARAGEQGRGFAVVAGEVRNLAQRAANAAKDIEGLINDSIEKIDRGTELSNKSGEALKEINISIEKVSKIIAEVAAASAEQKQGIDQVNVAVSEMDSMTQQNASLVEETASASEEMSNQAQELLDMVEKFKIDSNTSSSGIGSKRIQRKEIHLKTGARKRAAAAPGNEAAAPAAGAAPPAAGGKASLDDIMKEEGFEEF
ncbi:MAG: HAMP domain-containing protein [bacterium]|nr:HAMP domain-containing protein [bacterium]